VDENPFHLRFDWQGRQRYQALLLYGVTRKSMDSRGAEFTFFFNEASGKDHINMIVLIERNKEYFYMVQYC
jgi:hypothetical protein